MFDRTDRSRLGLWWWTVDKMMLTSILLLMILGALLVMAASPAVALRIGLDDQHFVWKHLLFFIPALFVLFSASILSIRMIRILSVLGLLVISGLMFSTLLISEEIKGATRWLSIGGLYLQPSEFIKPVFAIVCAWLLGLWRSRTHFPGWLWAFGVMVGICGMLLFQPDIGMSAVILLTFGFQIYLAGLPLLFILVALMLVPFLVWCAYSQFPHVRLRIDGFMQGGGWQTDRSLQSFIEGGWYGVGPGDGVVKHSLPDAHADFIFSVAAEEYGVAFCLMLIGIYGFILVRGYLQSLGTSDMFTMLAISGLVTQFGIQAAIHMGSSLNLIPAKGMTLPFISYGGSSMLANALTFGFILALTTQQSPIQNSPQTDNQPPPHFRPRTYLSREPILS